MLCLLKWPALAQDTAMHKQVYEIRQYVIADAAQGAPLDKFLSEGLLPALQRAQVGPVGAYAPAPGADLQDRFIVIPYNDLNAVQGIHAALDKDAEYLSALSAFEANGPKNPPYKRILSEVLLAMDCMPKLQVSTSVGEPSARVYELRIYESANEGLGDRKVEMFNNGEVPIFLDCGIIPVFLGQGIAGPYTPSLTYLTAYPSDAARLESWKKFLAHPDWKVLSAEPKYQGTVSKIYKHVLVALPGSEL
jgi:hypothetical protein